MGRTPRAKEGEGEWVVSMCDGVEKAKGDFPGERFAIAPVFVSHFENGFGLPAVEVCARDDGTRSHSLRIESRSEPRLAEL